MCRMCAFTGDEEAAENERNYLYERRKLLFSGALDAQVRVSKKTHYCRNDEEYGMMQRPFHVTHDGAYTEWWCPRCYRYLRIMQVEELNKAVA